MTCIMKNMHYFYLASFPDPIPSFSMLPAEKQEIGEPGDEANFHHFLNTLFSVSVLIGPKYGRPCTCLAWHPTDSHLVRASTMYEFM